jgi:hypothetical protein
MQFCDLDETMRVASDDEDTQIVEVVADEQPSHEHAVVEEVLAAPVRLPDGQMEIELD